MAITWFRRWLRKASIRRIRVGDTFGLLTVLEPVWVLSRQTWCWSCECECGRRQAFPRQELLQGRRNRCGACRHVRNHREDLALDVYDWLHIYGLQSVTRTSWVARFYIPGRKPGASTDPHHILVGAHRAWERLKQRWTRAGVPYGRAPHHEAHSRRVGVTLMVHLLPEVDAWLCANLKPLPDDT